MSSQAPDDFLLLIRCPSCGQRFKVGEELRDKTVECGGCEHRFRINDDTIVRGPRFYPGERADPALNRFQRVPLNVAPLAGGPQPMRYSNPPDASLLEPASPLRILAGAIGAGIMVIMALLLIFGASNGGMLDGMPRINRLVMAGFGGFMGTVLLIYANPKARMKGMLVGLLMAGGLAFLPFVFTTGSNTTDFRPESTQPVVPPPVELENGENEALMALRNRIGTDPLVKEIKRLESEGGTKHALGLWLRGLSQMNRLLVRDYIFRTTGADQATTHLYPRDDGDYLMVVVAPKQSIDEMAEITEGLGQTERIYQELSVIEIRVNNGNFTEGPIEKLSNKEDPAFYDLNKRELESIDIERVRRAVQRLAQAEPKIYRADITRKLVTLLKEDGIDFKGNICHALSTWSERPGPAGAAALEAVKSLAAQAKPVPQDMIALIVKEKNEAVIPILHQLWQKDPTTWESLYADLGPAIEPTVLQSFPSTEGPVRHSAVRLLGKVGGNNSLPILVEAGAGANAELRVLLEQAQKSIHERLAR